MRHAIFAFLYCVVHRRWDEAKMVWDFYWYSENWREITPKQLVKRIKKTGECVKLGGN